MKPKIFIDPGHGGTDSGTAGFGMKEKDINLLVARELAGAINLHEFEVMLSRNSDINVTLANRVKKAYSWGADLYISIHHNGFSDPAANGLEVYYQENNKEYTTESYHFALFVYNRLHETFSFYSRGVKAKKGNDGKDYFYVLRETRCPAIIIENGFLTNPFDAAVLTNSNYPYQYGITLITALEQFYNITPENLELENRKMKEILKLLNLELSKHLEKIDSIKELLKAVGIDAPAK